MDTEALRELLTRLQDGSLKLDEAVESLSGMSFEELGYAKLDHRRRMRTGYPEVIYGEGKTPEQGAAIFSGLAQKGDVVLCTRASGEMAAAIKSLVPEAVYHEQCRVVGFNRRAPAGKGLVAVLCAGTSDLPVAQEAAVVCEAFGSRVERVYDVGVAGIHRLFTHSKVIQEAQAIVAVAGMEGALASVVAGLVDVPVIAVPTSVGYGASFGGVAALLGMLNSCATGVAVVNIDNGFGAGVMADMINRQSDRKSAAGLNG